MRAFIIDKYKEPLREAEVAEPTVGERDVQWFPPSTPTKCRQH
ncbi:hypothetical protein LJR013_003400 [Pseudarthrobacter oxydans]